MHKAYWYYGKGHRLQHAAGDTNIPYIYIYIYTYIPYAIAGGPSMALWVGMRALYAPTPGVSCTLETLGRTLDFAAAKLQAERWEHGPTAAR